MPARSWKAAATAPPVSPEVATRMVSARSSAPRRRAKHAARKRAPKSLNAAVGPWNSSSTASRPSASSGTSGAGKSNASRVSSGSFPASGSPPRKGASSRAPTAGSPCSPAKSCGTSRGQLSGTYSPPSGASPCRSAALKPRAGASPRELLKRNCALIVASIDHPRTRRAQLHHPAVGRERVAREFALHRRQHGRGSALQTPGKHRRPGAGNRAAERPGLHCAAAHVLEAGDQRLPLRLDHHVLQRGTDHVEIVRVAAGDEAGEVRRLPDEVRQLDVEI